jgi:hypothetical protein
MIKSSGWSTHVLRELERFLIPKLAIEHSALANSKPIFPSLDQIRIKHIVNLKVDFPDFHDGLHKIEDQFLPLVIQMARRGLERGSKLLGEIDRYTRETPTLFPETMEGTHYHDARAKYFLWFGNLFQRLVILNPKSGAKEFEQWPSNEFHFDKLKLFALSFSKAFGPKEVINHLKSLNAAVFWDGGHVRELLLLLQKRWTEMSRQQRITVCKIILRGPAIWQDEDKKGYKRRLIVTKLEILVWLDEQGCQLPKFVHPEIKKLKLALPAWKDSWAETVANSREPRSGWVKTETDATGLKGLPISKIVEAATQQSKRTFAEFVEHKPFQGLTTDKSFLALAALSSSARSGNYPTLLWQELLSSWPKELSPRLNCLLALRLAKLPPNVAHELRHYLPRWLEENLPALAKKNQASAIDIWNRCLDSLVKTGSISTESSIGDAFVGGKKVMRSRRTFYHSSGPVGTFGDTIFKILDDLKLGKGKGIPASIRAGIERLWETPGEGADQALAITGRRLLWLDHIDPKWVKSKLLPHFALTSPNAEPAWSGYLHLQALPHQQLFALLKRDFVGLIEKMKQWQWGDDEQSEYSFLVVLACWWNQKDQKYTDWNMTRSILKLLDDSPRARAIYTVSQISFGKSAWKSFGKQFFERAWPKETAIQSNNTSTALVNLAEQADSLFPEVVKVISKFVYPLDHPDLFIFKMKKEGKKQSPELATRFPMSVLELLDRLVPIDRNYPPYDLSPLLNMMADANPKIRQDRRWLRLRRLVDAN